MAKQEAGLPELCPHAAGIDIGGERHFVAVGSGDPNRDVRSYGPFTADLEQMADWLMERGVIHVAMESTGVYWIPVFDVLERRGFQVQLVNPRQTRNMPGRKSDVMDCQWIQRLHACGLLRAAFRPDEQARELRCYFRHRRLLTQEATAHVQRMQKVLTQMNIQLPRVVSNIMGETGMKIIRAIVAGERDPKVLAANRNNRCVNDEATIAKALQGTWKREHLFELKQMLELWDVIQGKITDCDHEIGKCLEGMDDREPPSEDGDPPGKTDAPADTAAKRRRQACPLHFENGRDAREEAKRICGVDLTAISGMDAGSALALLGEIGTNMDRFPSEKHFASWLGLCPGSHKSGGKILGGQTRHVCSRASAILRMCALTQVHAKSWLGGFYRRMRATLGGQKAVTATARKMAVRIYAMLKHGQEYEERGEAAYEAQFKARQLHGLKKRAASLGLALVPVVA